jgi:hypothetical protein
VAILNPEHLLDQAERLISWARGAPRQADLRRAVSDTYYALFHAVCAAAANQFVGSSRQTDPLYGLVYRSVEHRSLRQLCEDIGKPVLPARYQPYLSNRSLGLGIEFFALVVVDLQAKRHAADYDPMSRLSISDARTAIRMARRALLVFEIPRRGRRLFLMLLLFPLR